MKMLPILKCGHCPHCRLQSLTAQNYRCQHAEAAAADSVEPDQSPPAWCPLPDAPESRV